MYWRLFFTGLMTDDAPELCIVMCSNRSHVGNPILKIQKEAGNNMFYLCIVLSLVVNFLLLL